MVNLASALTEYKCSRPLNLYKSQALEGLVTQAAIGRHVRFVPQQLGPLEPHGTQPQLVQLCEDDYTGWLDPADSSALVPVKGGYQSVRLSRSAIEPKLPEVIAFTRRAMAQPNTYLWGGTIEPNYDCSGLMQAAFASVGVRIPRDSYQQEDFTQPIGWDDLKPGDLVFFGTPERTNHVGLYLGDGAYIHSSGKDRGRNGIGIDSLTDLSHPVSQAYYAQRRRPGRVMHSYVPSGIAP